MNILIPEHRQILIALLNHNVSFMLIGGYAVNYYGYERMTGDMDVWLPLDNDNRDRLISALDEFGIEEAGLEKIRGLDFTFPQEVIWIGAVPRRIDFLTKVDNLSFHEAITQVKYFRLEDKQVPVIHYHHLILTKLTTGRPKDKADIDELQRIRKYKNDT